MNTSAFIRRLEKLESSRVSAVVLVRTTNGSLYKFKASEIHKLCAAAIYGEVSTTTEILKVAVTENRLIQLMQMVTGSEGDRE